MKHAKFSPSTAEKWLNCPASVWMERDKPDDAGPDAWQGTCAHFLAKYCLDEYDQGDVPPTLIGQKILLLRASNGSEECMFEKNYRGIGEIVYTCEIDFWMRECVAKYTTAIYRATPAREAMRFVEQEFPLEPVTGEVGAVCTPDCAIVAGNSLQIHDLKYGRTPVYAKDNPQLMLYAAALVHHFPKINNIELFIHQPQINNYSCHTITLDELEIFIETASTQVSKGVAILNGAEPQFNAGYWCGTGHCKARFECGACAGYIEQQFLIPYDLPLNHDDMHAITEDQAVNIWKNRKLIRGLVDGIEEYLENEMRKGRQFPGIKLVRGKNKSRQWKDKEQATESLKKMRIKSEVKFPPGLASPTQLEKAYKAEQISRTQWDSLQDLIRKGGSTTQIALDDDARESIQPTTEVFENLEQKTQIDDNIFL